MNDTVLLITLNYNNNEYTLKCVDSILKSSYKKFKILLIDNGSDEVKYLELKRRLSNDNRIDLIRIEKNIGYVNGVNYGLKMGIKLKPTYFLIINNDTIIDKDAMQALVETCKSFENKAIITGKVLSYTKPEIIQTTGTILTNKKMLTGYFVGKNETDKGQYDYIQERDIIDDIFWLFPVNLINEIGYYSEWFNFGYEQADFAFRAKKIGFKLIYSYKAKLWHFGNATVGRGNSQYKVFWSLQGFLMFRYLYQKNIYFMRTYLTSWLVIMKSIFLDIANLLTSKQKKYSVFLLLSMLRFHVWLIFRVSNNWETSFLKYFFGKKNGSLS